MLIPSIIQYDVDWLSGIIDGYSLKELHIGVCIDVGGIEKACELFSGGMNDANDVESKSPGGSFDKTRSKHQTIDTKAANTK